MHQFNDKQLHTIACALRVAAEVYDSDAKTAREAGDTRTADAFNRQAADSRRIESEIIA